MPSFAMTQSAAQALLAQYGAIIDNYLKDGAQFSIDNVIARLEAELTKAMSAALNVYHLLGYSGDDLETIEEDFNNRIKELQEITFSFNGLDLYKTFVSTLSQVQTFKFDEEQEYQKFLNECKSYIDTVTGQEVTRNKDQFINAAYSLLGPYIAQVQGSSKKSKTGGFIAENVNLNSKGILYDTKTGYNIGVFTEVLATCGKNIRLGFQKYLKEKNKQLVKKTGQEIVSTETSTINGQSLELTFNFDFNGNNGKNLAVSFLKMNKAQREMLFASYPGLQEEIVQRYKQEILNKCNVPQEYKSFLELAIDKVVGIKEGSLDALFGATGANLTGVLGEIQALFYILVITNGKNSQVPTKWIGGINNPHADILIGDIAENYGIQVKNTMSPLGAQKEIEFQSFGMSGWNEKLKKNQISGNNGIFKFKNTEDALRSMHDMGLPSNLSQAVQTILAMETFNIEYIRKGWKAIPHPNEQFAPTRSQILDYAEKCQQVMVAFITSMMYMQTSNLSGGSSNTIYIIAGTTAISAASIISNIIKEMREGIQSFRMSMRTSSSMSGLENQYNITDVINGEKRISNLHFAFQSSYTFKR